MNYRLFEFKFIKGVINYEPCVYLLAQDITY